MHPPLATSHEAVEVRPPDEGSPGALGDGRDDVAAGQDAAVDVDLCSVADGLDDRGERLEGRGGPVELAPAVVRDDDRVGTGVDDGPRVLDGAGCP